MANCRFNAKLDKDGDGNAISRRNASSRRTPVDDAQGQGRGQLTGTLGIDAEVAKTVAFVRELLGARGRGQQV